MLPLAIFYALYYALIVFFLTIGQPASIAMKPYPVLALETPVVDVAATGILLAIPPLVAATTYLVLFLSTKERPQRFRVALVAAGTIAWFAGSAARDASLATYAPIMLGLLSAWAVSWAYAPPKWIQKRWVARVD
jgi:hypothetical protein